MNLLVSTKGKKISVKTKSKNGTVKSNETRVVAWLCNRMREKKERNEKEDTKTWSFYARFSRLWEGLIELLENILL